ncbi:MAG: DUF86 domain-containing protein [Geothermobacteraceae bacterium]
MVDKGVLQVRIDRFRECVEILEKALGFIPAKFVEDPFVYGSAERHMHLALECLLDIGNHIIADRGYPRPSSDADIFRILIDQDVLPETMRADLEGMAAFRNLLVHDYLRLDRHRFYQILVEKLPVLKEVGRRFAALL